MSGTWQFLPQEGGIIDQDPDLMEDLIRWKALVNTARRIRDADEPS